MTAQRLRDAARGMREKAEGATPGPWQWYVRADNRWALVEERVTDDRLAVARCSDDDTAAYIAAMHPAVGLAVADLLEREADLTAFGHPDAPMIEACVVADAFLGQTEG